MQDTNDCSSVKKSNQSRIHSWDNQTIFRALYWFLGIEVIFVGLYAAGYLLGGAPPGGAPHNFPHPLILVSTFFHLRSILIVAG